MSKRMTYAENLLKWKVGCFNIDACRIGNETIYANGYASSKLKNGTSPNGILGKFDENYEGRNNTGRFPANLILSHTSDCEYLGVDEEEVVTLSRTNDTVAYGHYKEMESSEPRVSKVAKYSCSPDCPCRLMDEQSGISKSTDNVRYNSNANKANDYGKYNPSITKGFTDSGGASRFFIQIESEPNE